MCGAEEQAVHRSARFACGENTIRSFTNAIGRPAPPNGGDGKAMCEAGWRLRVPSQNYDRRKAVLNGFSVSVGNWEF